MARTTKKTTTKTKVMFSPKTEAWRRLKIHAAASGYGSAQELLEEVMNEWLQSHPLMIEELDSNKTTQNGGN